MEKITKPFCINCGGNDHFSRQLPNNIQNLVDNGMIPLFHIKKYSIGAGCPGLKNMVCCLCGKKGHRPYSCKKFKINLIRRLAKSEKSKKFEEDILLSSIEISDKVIIWYQKSVDDKIKYPLLLPTAKTYQDVQKIFSICLNDFKCRNELCRGANGPLADCPYIHPYKKNDIVKSPWPVESNEIS